MARAALRWTLQELANRAGVSRATLTRFEAEQGSPIGATLTDLRGVAAGAAVNVGVSVGVAVGASAAGDALGASGGRRRTTGFGR